MVAKKVWPKMRSQTRALRNPKSTRETLWRISSDVWVLGGRPAGTGRLKGSASEPSMGSAIFRAFRAARG